MMTLAVLQWLYRCEKRAYKYAHSESIKANNKKNERMSRSGREYVLEYWKKNECIPYIKSLQC